MADEGTEPPRRPQRQRRVPPPPGPGARPPGPGGGRGPEPRRRCVGRRPCEPVRRPSRTSDDVGARALAAQRLPGRRGPGHVVFLALRLQRPLLLEGEAGVGKTEVAKVLAAWTGGELIRLQCYEGIDVAQARLRVGPRPPAPPPAGGRGRGPGRRRRAPRRSRTSSTPSASSCAARCSRAIDRRATDGRRRCCSSTRSTGPTTSSRRSCSRSSPTTRSPSPSSARSGPRSPPVVVHHVEPHPRRARRPQAPLPLPLGRAPDFEREVAIVRLRAPEVAERAGPPGGGGRRGAARRAASTSRRASPRRSTGRRRSPPSGAPTLDEASVGATLGTVLKYREDHERVRGHGRRRRWCRRRCLRGT